MLALTSSAALSSALHLFLFLSPPYAYSVKDFHTGTTESLPSALSSPPIAANPPHGRAPRRCLLRRPRETGESAPCHTASTPVTSVGSHPDAPCRPAPMTRTFIDHRSCGVFSSCCRPASIVAAHSAGVTPRRRRHWRVARLSDVTSIRIGP